MLNVVNNEYEALRAKILARALKDPLFAADLLKDCSAALKSMGIQLPRDVKLTVVVQNENTYLFFLPPPPPDLESLSTQELYELALSLVKNEII